MNDCFSPQVTLANPDDTSKPVKLPSEQVKIFNLPAEVNLLDAGALKIRERFFPFMVLKFSLKVSFIGRDRDISHMSSSHSVWIDIERSELSVVIKGMLSCMYSSSGALYLFAHYS